MFKAGETILIKDAKNFDTESIDALKMIATDNERMTSGFCPFARCNCHENCVCFRTAKFSKIRYINNYPAMHMFPAWCASPMISVQES